MGPFLEVLLGGLLTGVLYSLVALGFVLIFKASGVFNFAQGAMVLFAALAMARLQEWLTPSLGWVAFPVALALSAAIMMGLAFAIERLVLRYLINQEGIILFMARSDERRVGKECVSTFSYRWERYTVHKKIHKENNK